MAVQSWTYRQCNGLIDYEQSSTCHSLRAKCVPSRCVDPCLGDEMTRSSSGVKVRGDSGEEAGRQIARRRPARTLDWRASLTPTVDPVLDVAAATRLTRRVRPRGRAPRRALPAPGADSRGRLPL